MIDATFLNNDARTLASVRKTVTEHDGSSKTYKAVTIGPKGDVIFEEDKSRRIPGVNESLVPTNQTTNGPLAVC